MLPDNTQVLNDVEELAAVACHFIVAAARAAIRQSQVFRLVLAGGRTPRRVYELLALTEQEQDWASWEIFWGDERCLPVDHPERNSSMAYRAWLAQAAIPGRQIYPIPAEFGAAKASAAYAETIRDKLPFDLLLLGMGEDGHTASLFPGRAAAGGLTIAVHDAPKAPAERVSLNYSLLRECRMQLVLVAGAGKASALAAWQAGEDLPIARAARSDAALLLDRACLGSRGVSQGEV